MFWLTAIWTLIKKSADLGNEGLTYFVVILDDVPSAVIKAGNYDYTVAIAK